MCIIPPLLLTGRENDEEDKLMKCWDREESEVENYQICDSILFSNLIICYFTLLVSATEIFYSLVRRFNFKLMEVG